MLRWVVTLAACALLAACDLPPDHAADGGAICAVCATADLCCAAHTANPDSNCQLHATCVSFATPGDQASVAGDCAYYLRVASTPPGPAACGPHPDAD